MTPLEHFDQVWKRCADLSAIHAHIRAAAAGSFNSDELLRAEWAIRISALDLYVHELVAQEMLAIFEGRRPASAAYQRFRVSNETLERIRAAATPQDPSAAFDLDVRQQLETFTYQNPDKIAEGVRLISDIELWNEVAVALGASAITKVARAKSLKNDLSAMVTRRNKIVHEGDLQPLAPRTPSPIAEADVALVASSIETIVLAIDDVV